MSAFTGELNPREILPKLTVTKQMRQVLEQGSIRSPFESRRSWPPHLDSFDFSGGSVALRVTEIWSS